MKKEYLKRQFVTYDVNIAYRDAMKEVRWLLDNAKKSSTYKPTDEEDAKYILDGARLVDINDYGNGLTFRDKHLSIHRDGNKPAYIIPGQIEYGVHGKAHRTDGPAHISNSFLGWFVNGKAHRTDGPAKIWHTNTHFCEFWVKGKKLSEWEFLQHFDLKESKFANMIREIG